MFSAFHGRGDPERREPRHDDTPADRALCEGLGLLTVPQVSPGFDARVLGALKRRTPWWRTAWPTLRPVLSGAACSLLIMLAVLHWTALMPVDARAQQSSATTNLASTGSAIGNDMDGLGALSASYLFRANALSALSLQAPEQAPTAVSPLPLMRPQPAPARRSEIRTRPLA